MDKAMEALKPCPFCGGAATLSDGESGDFNVCCHSRDCFGPHTALYYLRSDAIAAWNTRATPEPVAPTPDQMVRLADVIAVIDDNQYALERVPVGWNLLVKIRAGINAIPVAPTPSPDIAGLVGRALNYVNDPDQLEHCDPKYLRDDLEELATALQRVAQERDDLRKRLFPYADDKEISGMSWGGFYLIGNDKSIKELQRIENAAAQIEVYRAAFDERVATAEARLSSARDEGLEMALEPFAADRRHSLEYDCPVYCDDDPKPTHNKWVIWREEGNINDREWVVVAYGDTPAAAIRALKGTKP
jgi:hypothetical protein